METGFNEYAQGSIWHWDDKAANEQYKEGVQSGNRPVLIISNDIFNKHSISVNCVTITSVLKESPVHVPIEIQTASHIQCEQLHTIPKRNLSRFLGMAGPRTLSEVKKKLNIQLGIREKNLEVLEEISGKLDKIADSLQAGFRGSEKDAYITDFMKAMLLTVVEMKTGAPVQPLTNQSPDAPQSENLTEKSVAEPEQEAQAAEPSQAALNQKAREQPENSKGVRNPAGNRKSGYKQRKYEQDEIEYILDKKNNPKDIMDMFSLDSLAAAYSLRYRFKKQVTG